MANKQQQRLSKLGIKTQNLGDHTQESKIEHGPRAFRTPCQARKAFVEKGGSSWKITKRHPSHVKVGDR